MPPRFLRNVRTGLAALLCCLAAEASFAVDGLVDNTILFGMSAPLTGPTGAYGRQMKEGIDACFAKVNAAGGAAGRQLKLVALDDGYDVAPAVANTKRLIEQEKVFGLMAFYGTASSTAVLPLIDRAAVPLIGTISGAAVLRAPGNQHMFHLRASYGDETAAIVRNLLTVGMNRIAVLYQDDGFGQAGLKGVEAALAAQKLTPVAAAAVPRNSVEVAQAVVTIAEAKPQAVVMVTLYRPTAAFVRQMSRGGLHPYFVALSPVGTDQLIAELGAEASRGIQVAQVIPYPWGNKLEIVRDYKRDLAALSKSASPSYYGLEGYLNARLVVAALERAGAHPTREHLEAALRAGPFNLGGYKVNFAPRSNEGSSYVEISVIGTDGRILN
ncbi:MAG: ABC transporter substrate-binding protein [Burkholderiales bacterium]